MNLLHPESPWIGDQEIPRDALVVAASPGELAVMSSAINEALEAIEEWEFETRVGVTPVQARDLQARIAGVLREAESPH
jgi:hypothetical protein